MTTTAGPEPLSLPAADDDWATWLRSVCDDPLAEAKRLAERLKSEPPGTADEVLRLWNDIHVMLGNVFGAAGLMAQVHPDEALRTQAEEAEQAAQRFVTELMMDREVYDVLAAVEAEPLDRDATRVLELTLRDFRRAGVDRDEATRDRLRELNEQETLLEQEFSKNTRDDVRTVSLAPAQLDGLPQDYIEAHPAGDDGRVTISTDYPDAIPFLQFATDPVARRELITEFLNRGWPDNDRILKDLLALRDEHAKLLGYTDWPDYDAEVKMIGKGAAIGEFIDEIAAAAEERGRRDVGVLLARLQQDRPDATAIDRSDSSYYAELVRKEQYDVDAQEVRQYFDFTKVRRGLLDVTGRLFGVTYEPVDVAVWHEDVATYDVLRDGTRLGRIHLDLHPREGKFKHAAQFSLVSGIRGRQLPQGTLVCNFPRGLMEHSDVVTLFHEFGHLVHHVLGGDQEWARFSGVATEWDFVEAPSQMLEEWAWDAGVLQTFATNAEGAPIPTELVAKMRRANDFGKGYQARTQMFYASVSYRLHRQRTDDITKLVHDLQRRYDLIAPLKESHFHASFGHLTGYTSAYYTYMWSLVIAKDMFSAFDEEDLFDPVTTTKYRDRVLAQGGRRDAADLVADFLGRPYDAEAFRRWLNR